MLEMQHHESEWEWLRNAYSIDEKNRHETKENFMRLKARLLYIFWVKIIYIVILKMSF